MSDGCWFCVEVPRLGDRPGDAPRVCSGQCPPHCRQCSRVAGTMTWTCTNACKPEPDVWERIVGVPLDEWIAADTSEKFAALRAGQRMPK